MFVFATINRYIDRVKNGNYIDEIPAGRDCIVKMVLNNAYPRRELLIEMRLRYKLHILKYEYSNGFVQYCRAFRINI